MKSDPDWAVEAVHELGKRVASWRERRGMTVQQLSDRCAELGLPIGRVTIAKLENGLRQGVTPYEVIVLAAVLGVAPIELILPIGREKRVQLWPGAEVDPLSAVRWFCGDAALNTAPGDVRVRRPASGEESSTYLLQYHDELIHKLAALTGNVARAAADFEADPEDVAKQAALARAKREAQEWNKYPRDLLQRTRDEMRQRGMILPVLPAGLDLDERD